MIEKKELNRRDFITKGSLAVAGVTLAASGLGTILSGCSPDEQEPADTNQQTEAPQWPWTYTKLDPDTVAQRAYEGYAAGG